jgi:hypothetical protein
MLYAALMLHPELPALHGPSKYSTGLLYNYAQTAQPIVVALLEAWTPLPDTKCHGGI